MTEWKTGDVITAERLNGMTAPMIVGQHATIEGALDKTWKEMYDAWMQGIPVIIKSVDEDDYQERNFYAPLVWMAAFIDKGTSASGRWEAKFEFQNNTVMFSTTEENGYPIAI